MTKSIKVFSAILLCFSLSSAQDFNLTGAGARAEGFGGAFIGLADDATAVVWNPAGLTQLERAEASIVTRYISEKVGYNYSDNSSSASSEESQGHFSLNFGSFAFPLSKGNTKIVAAFAFQRQLDFYLNKTEDYGTYKYKQESKGGANTITPGIAATFGDLISAGVSVNIWTGSWNFGQTISNSGSVIDQNSTDVNFSGLNFVIGGLFDFERKQNGFPLKLGLTMRTPFTLKGDVSKGGGSLEINMPFMIGFGGSYRIGDNLTLALDYEMRSYADKKVSVNGTDIGNISESNKSLNEFRVGAEYLVVMEKAVIPLRVGYKTVPTILADETLNYDNFSGTFSTTSTTNQVVGSGISFGSGYIADAFAFDITYSRTKYVQNLNTNILLNGSKASTDYITGTLSTSIIFYF